MMLKQICVAVLALSGPALAKDPSGSAFYVGAHISSADGVSQDQAAMDDGDKIDTSGTIAGLVVGHIWRNGAINFSIEGDIGIGSVNGSFQGLGFTDTYKIGMNAHLKTKLGYELSDRFNVFVLGGIASASHQYAYDYDIGGAESDTQTLLGWTVGAGLGFEALKGTILNIEIIHDDYGKKEYYFPVVDIHEDARASANFFRASIVQEF